MTRLPLHKPASNRHIVAVDDDPRIRQMLARYFEGQGFQVTTLQSGRALLEFVAAASPDLVLLDIGIAGEDGIAIARELRARSDIGIIMLAGRNDVVDRVVGLEVGADDYVAKPFELRELLARVRAVLRRVRPAPPASRASAEGGSEGSLRFQGWRLDLKARRLVPPAGRPVSLTTGEFALLRAFATNPGRVLNRDRLMDLTKGRDWVVFDRSIDNQVSRLRKKLEKDPHRPTLIKSVRGAGYLFTAEVAKD